VRAGLRRSMLLACVVAGAACGGDDGGGPVVPPPGNSSFIATGGAGQDGAGHPTPVTSVVEAGGQHTGTFAAIGERDFVFAARNPGDPALVVYDVTGALH